MYQIPSNETSKHNIKKQHEYLNNHCILPGQQLYTGIDQRDGAARHDRTPNEHGRGSQVIEQPTTLGATCCVGRGDSDVEDLACESMRGSGKHSE